MKLTSLTFIGLAAFGLSACESNRYESSGFSGIGSEVGTTDVSRTDRYFAVTSAGQINPEIPRLTARSGSSNNGVLAEKAIRSGGSTPGRSQSVVINGQKLALSIVDVNSTTFAVLKTPSGLFSSAMNADVASAFKSQLHDLTGCGGFSNVYSYGSSPNKPIGMAMQLNCG